MKMSEIDHTNSLDPDQAQQNVWQDPKEKGPKDLRMFRTKTHYSASQLSMQRVKTKTLLYLEHDNTCWVYDVTNDQFFSLQQATK